MLTVTNDILEKAEFNAVMQQSAEPIAQERFANDAKYNYFMSVKAQLASALPLLAKVVNRQLTLHSYRIESAHCRAFAKTCDAIAGHVNTTAFLSKLLLDNCGVSDADFAELIRGITKLKTLSQIIYRKNEFGEKSVWQIQPILLRPFGQNHLQDLRIVDCKITPKASY